MRILLLVLVIVLLLAQIPAPGVAQDDLAPPLRPTCDDSLQGQVDAAAAGSVVLVRTDCIYRETVTLSHAITLDGQGGAEIRGSDIWTDWAPFDGGWRSLTTVPEFYSHGSCAGDERRCLWPEQVFIDGEPLRQVASESTPGSGEFSIAPDRHVLIADDPSGAVVEVTIRRHWIRVEADDVAIQSFAMRHAANDSQDGALTLNGFDRWTIQGNQLSHAHGGLVHFNDTSEGSLLGNDLSFGGQQGFSGSGTDVVISGNVVHHNNTEGFSTGWEAGGAKVTRSSRVVVEGNEFAWNSGPGFWCDIDCRDVVITDNDVHHNDGIGIFFEISDGAQIFRNRVWENARQAGGGWVMQAGILIASSRNTEVHNNVVAWNGDGIAVVSQCRAHFADGETCDLSAGVNLVAGVQVHDNVIVMDVVGAGGGDAFAMAWERDIRDGDGTPFDYMLTPDAANGGWDNRYWVLEPHSGRGILFSWGDDQFTDLLAFNETPGEENGTLISIEERDRILMDAGIPTTPQPEPAR